ncbi:BLUF domain-containing protein [Microbacterium sp. NPDC090225]|uniref:BLUF domain-containing protein n=1 Tax=Microbacterium sp. NPDC090225 TaxID=3364207 RepID=UPI0037FF52E2
MSAELVSVVYTSTASQPFRGTALDELLATCRRRNGEHDVTGMLLYREGRFIQVLEGPRATVDSLIEAIRRDRRHHDLRVLLDDAIPQRRFTDWTMGYRPLRDSGGAVPDGYRDSFDDLDDGADGETARRALAELTLWFRVRASRSVTGA